MLLKMKTFCLSLPRINLQKITMMIIKNQKIKNLSSCLFFMMFFSSMQAQDLSGQEKSNAPAQRWQIGMQGGMGFTLASAKGMEKSLINTGADEKLARDFCKQLKWGYQYGANIHFMLNRRSGLGLKYSGFYTSANSYMIFDPQDAVSYWFIDMGKRYYINFIGFSFRTQRYLAHSGKFRLTSDAALGYVHYRDEEEYDYYWLRNYLLKSSTFGFNLELGIEYSLLNWLSIGASATYFGAWFRKGTLIDENNSTTVKFKDLQGNINASRLDFSMGLKFYL